MNNQPYETRSMRDSLDGLEVDFLHGVPVRLPEKIKQQILDWHETEKQKYAMAYADEIIGKDDITWANCEDGFIGKARKRDKLRAEQRELNKSNGGKTQ